MKVCGVLISLPHYLKQLQYQPDPIEYGHLTKHHCGEPSKREREREREERERERVSERE